jgi:hypothetical protein
LVPDRSYDDDRLREESLGEQAHSQSVLTEGVALSDLVGADEPPRLALPDLSLIDGRFSSELIASELKHLVDLWELAVTGSQAPFKELASSNATRALLRPGRGYRLVVRDAVLKSWEPTKLELSRKPPAIELSIDVEAVRFITKTNGSHCAGNIKERHVMNLSWVLELTDSVRTPWRLTKSSDPAQAIPGWSLFSEDEG